MSAEQEVSRVVRLPTGAAGAPPAPVRGERVLVGVDQVFSRLDGWLARALPPEVNPLAQSGRAANFALLVAVVTGVWMLLWYSPSLQLAYPSLASIAGRTLGGWVRAAHRYSSDLVMLLLLVHAGRMFFARKFSGARWLPWVSGVGLIALVWFIGWTGYWLVWDQPAQQVAVSSMRLLDGLPIFGEPLGRLYVADRTVPSLLFFVVFFLHMLLPLGIALGLVVHLMRVSRVRLLPGWRLGLALSAGVALAAWLVPAPLDEAARMAVKAERFTVDAWYLSPLALGLRFQHAGLWVALFGTLALGAAVPWIFGRRRKADTFQAAVEVSRCHGCTQCVQDCPFDAVTMVARTDGKRFVSQAQVDPARCVGCGVCAGSCDSDGITLTWFDTRIEEARIEAEIAGALAAGGAPWVALVAGDIDGGAAFFPAARWGERLPEYQVHFVPTASWVRPALVERLLKSGVRGVLVVRDARAEAAARDGNRWVLARLEGERTPVFRPARAGAEGVWRVVDFDPSAAADLVRAAAELRGGKPETSGGRRTLLRSATVVAVLAVALGAAAIAPSHLEVKNPGLSDPELVFSFKVFGDMIEPAVALADQSNVPVHMRGRSTIKPRRADVLVRLVIDGVTDGRSFSAKGISHDGPAIEVWRRAVSTGRHAVEIEVLRGPAAAPLRWVGEIDAQPRRMYVVTYEPGAGFRLE